MTDLALSGGWIDRFARFGSSATAIVIEERALDYATLAEWARRSAGSLADCGLQAGDLVAILAPPSAAGVALIHALLDREIVMLPLNARLSETEQQAILTEMGVHCLLTSAGAGAVESRAQRLAEQVGCGLLAFDDEAGFDPEIAGPRPSAASGAAGEAEPSLTRESGPRVELLCPAPISAAAEQARARRRSEGAALVLMTSGTSGRPKGAVLTLANLVASAEASGRLLGSAARDRWLLCMPIFHIGGLSILMRAALVGARVVLHDRFDAERVARSLASDGITRVSLVATMLERLLDGQGGRRAPATLELVLLGGGPASQGLMQRALELGYPIAPTYGLTEAASQVATRPPGSQPPEGDLAAGLVPLPGVELRVVDASGRPLEPGREGEIEVRGPIVMRGYLDDEAATRAAIREGWLATGDQGRLDPAGGLRVLDRRSDLIVSGGENVYPAEIESVLAAHPEVVEAGVIGVPDAEYGQRPVAFVVTVVGARVDRASLRAWCRAALASYKVPRDVVFVPTLPRTASGKLQRRRLGG